MNQPEGAKRIQEEIIMTSFRITLTSAKEQLYTRRLWIPAVAAKAAVEAVPAKDDQPAVEAQEAVQFKPAEHKYFPFVSTFEFESINGFPEVHTEGKAVFEHWITHENGLSELGEAFNILVEKGTKTFSVSYDKSFTADIDAVLAIDNNLETPYDVEVWLENNGDSELDYPDDTGEISNIDVTEDSDEFIEVEWNG